MKELPRTSVGEDSSDLVYCKLCQLRGSGDKRLIYFMSSSPLQVLLTNGVQGISVSITPKTSDNGIMVSGSDQ